MPKLPIANNNNNNNSMNNQQQSIPSALQSIQQSQNQSMAQGLGASASSTTNVYNSNINYQNGNNPNSSNCRPNFQYVLEQTWDFGTENLKKKEQNIKNELIQRNKLKPDMQDQYQKIFPALEKHQSRIQKTKSEKFHIEQQRHYTTISKMITSNSIGFQQTLLQLHKPQ